MSCTQAQKDVCYLPRNKNKGRHTSRKTRRHSLAVYYVHVASSQVHFPQWTALDQWKTHYCVKHRSQEHPKHSPFPHSLLLTPSLLAFTGEGGWRDSLGAVRALLGKSQNIDVLSTAKTAQSRLLWRRLPPSQPGPLQYSRIIPYYLHRAVVLHNLLCLHVF